MGLPSTLIGFTVGLLLIGTTELAAQDNCQPLYAAMSKVITTPTHIYGASEGVRTMAMQG